MMHFLQDEFQNDRHCAGLSHKVLSYQGSVRSVMVIVVGNGLGDTCSNPGRD